LVAEPLQRGGNFCRFHARPFVARSVETLPVGDLVCEYGEGRIWIAERKRADDLAKSIKSGRWPDQLSRLHATGCRRIFFLIEGDLRSTSLNHESLLGACVNAALRQNAHVFRTADLEETAAVVRHLVQKGGGAPAMPPGILTPPLSKRKRDADRDVCWIRQLMCIPSISERIARKLLDEYGTLPAIQRALVDIKSFKKIRLDDRTCLGKARLQKLSHHLIDGATGA
jgi:ERCC4-type nuclease